MSRKILLSIISGLAILFSTWVYQNYNFSFNVEDTFINKLSFWKYKIFSAHPQHKADIVFINTGKDLTLVNDSTDYGNVTVSNREGIYKILHFINEQAQKPVYTVVDIQFYYPYSIKPDIDALMQGELDRNDKVLIAVLPDNRKDTLSYRQPIYHTNYGYSEYQTFGTGFNKFRIINHGAVESIPVMLDEKINHTIYKDAGLYATRNGHLCLAAIWPSFYLNDIDVRNNRTGYTQFYNMGELLLDMQLNAANYRQFFKDKIVIVGNFEQDVHITPIGQMAGSVVVANLYLSLLNRHHVVSYLFLFLMLVVFSFLSYLAWFSKMPEIKLRLRFIFSPYLVNYIKSYVSYFGCMLFLSILAVLFFDMQVALFMPSFIFSIIEYFSQKKYLPEKK